MQNNLVLIHPGIFEGSKHLVRLIKALELWGYQPIVHKCWGVKSRKVDPVFNLAHSGGFLCPMHQQSNSFKLSFDPTTVSPLRAAIEMPIKAVKDILFADPKFSAYKLSQSVRESINLLYWLRLVKAYFRMVKTGYKFKLNELVVASTNDGFCNLDIIKRAPKYKIIPGLHDQILNHPAQFKGLITNHFNQ